MCIAEEGLDLGLLQEQYTQVCDLLESLELLGWDLVVEVLQEQYTQVCDLLESQEPAVLAESLELCGLLLALSFSLVFSSQVHVSSLLNWG